MASQTAITICSVSYNSKPWLEINWELASRLNPGADLTWLVAENSPPGSNLRVDTVDPHVKVLPGAAFERRVYASGSYHHGRAMNLLVHYIRSRFVLFCDPDFYIVKTGWVSEILKHMTAGGLAVFGAPWHPKWVYKQRYFPCVHCMFVDLERVRKKDLDFEPDYESVPAHARDPADSKQMKSWAKLPDPLKLRKRRYIGTSRDVSWRIGARLSGDPSLRMECLQPVFHPRGERLPRYVDWLMPDRLSITPKRKSYFTERRFQDYGLPDLDARGWEEFLWQGEPFGFHVRSQPKVKERQSLESHLAEVVDILGRLSAGA
jgi:hypothetical protein